jgi:hypothetical protein
MSRILSPQLLHYLIVLPNMGCSETSYFQTSILDLGSEDQQLLTLGRDHGAEFWLLSGENLDSI